jgi:hypothetical protein
MIEQDFAWLRASVATRRGSRWRARWVGVVAVAVVAGCANTGGGLAPDSPAALKEKVVAERANARWQALIKRDYDGAYAFFSPASRETTSLSKFQAQIQAIEYRAVAIEKIECGAEVCKVTLQVTYDFPPAKIRGVVTPLDENWIIDKGQAWFVFRG